MKNWTHKELVEKAIRWLRKPLGQGGAGCHVAVSECKTGYDGEQPDAMGFRAYTEMLGGSVMCEVKVSRADFKADRHKPHRNGTQLGVGEHRFYVAPVGLISPSELPDSWGLVEVTQRGGTRCVCGYPSTTHYGDRQSLFKETRLECNRERELNLLIRLLARVGDPEELNLIRRDNHRLTNQVNQLSTELTEYRTASMIHELEQIRASSTPLHRQHTRAQVRLDKARSKNT